MPVGPRVLAPSPPTSPPPALYVNGISHERDTDISYRKILVIYTGGTIGMKWDKAQGYTPSSGYLFKELSVLSLVNDYMVPASPTTTFSPWLSFPISHESSEGMVEERGTIYKILEHSPLLDSSNMNMDDWFSIASDIERYYSHFDSFVILHGTDTMAYTASALSFLLENLGKTVILTGSQIPLAESRSDALHNFIGAMTIAARYCIPEVTIFFGNKLLRGNRVTKFDAQDFEAFVSHNMPPLAILGVHIRITYSFTLDVDWQLVIKPAALDRFHVHKEINPNVSILRLFPGIPATIVESFLRSPIRGVVLETFGVGNAPTNRPELLQLFKEAAERDVIIVNVSQCGKGMVQNDRYATGRFLASYGIVAGGDMTVETAISKLSYLLGKSSLTSTQVRQLLATNLVGEMTMPIKPPIYSIHDHEGAKRDNVQDTTALDRLLQLIDIDADGIIVPAVLERLVHEGRMDMMRQIKDLFPLFFSKWIIHPHIPSLLHIAARIGNDNAISFLLQNGLSVHALDDENRTPLVVAIIKGHYRCAELIMETGGNINQPSQILILTALSKAMIQQKSKLVALICRSNVNLGMPFDPEERTILHVASLQKSPYFKMLMDAFPSKCCLRRALVQKDIYGRTPLDNARAVDFEEPAIIFSTF